jgi:hypothetical protein
MLGLFSKSQNPGECQVYQRYISGKSQDFKNVVSQQMGTIDNLA